MSDGTLELPVGTRAIIIADLHLHHYPAWRLEWCQNFVEGFFDMAPLHPTPLVLLGDVFEIKDKLDSRVANMFMDLALGWPGPTYWVAGQHDSFQPYMATFYALHEAHPENGPFVVDSGPRVMAENLWLIPYARHPDKYREWLAEIPDGATVLTHMPIKEVLDQFPGGAPDRWPRLDDFERFDMVYSGDIHHECVYGNVEYIGATGQRDWRDEGVEGCWAFLENDDRLTRVRTEHPQHVRIKSRDALAAFKATTPAVVRVQGFDVTEAEIDSLRNADNVLAADWEPSAIEQRMEDHTDTEDEELTDLEIVKEYLGTLVLGEDALGDDFLTEVAMDILGGSDAA